MNQPAMMPQQEAPQKKPIAAPLNQTRIQESSYKRSDYYISAPAGTNFEDVLDHTYWRHVGHMLKPTDMIDFTTEDGQFYARLFVVSAARLWAKVAVVSYVDLREARVNLPLTDEQNHIVEWKGTNSKYAVIRRSDGAMLREGFNTQVEGYAWLEEHLKNLAA